jgi:hypothetical protein
MWQEPGATSRNLNQLFKFSKASNLINGYLPRSPHLLDSGLVPAGRLLSAIHTILTPYLLLCSWASCGSPAYLQTYAYSDPKVTTLFDKGKNSNRVNMRLLEMLAKYFKYNTDSGILFENFIELEEPDLPQGWSGILGEKDKSIETYWTGCRGKCSY